MHKALTATLLSTFLVIVIFCFSGSSTAQTPAAEKKAAAVHAGQDIFVHNCLQCHSVNEGQVSFGPSLYGELKKPHPKKSAPEVRIILKNGKGKMPSFQEKLSTQDIDNLLAYLQMI